MTPTTSDTLRGKILLRSLLIADGYKHKDMLRINAALQSVTNDIYGIVVATEQRHLLERLVSRLPSYGSIESHHNPELPHEEIYEAGYNHAIGQITALLQALKEEL